jgi:hypothetical protein
MPAYVNNAYQKPILVQKGVPCYLWGGLSQKIGNTRLGLSTDAIAANVATVTGQKLEGPLPVVGDLVSIINSANSAGAFNVNRAILTTPAPTYNAATNVMTLTFALTGTNQSATADGGTVFVEPGETSEAIVNNGTSIACLVQAPEGDSQFTVPVVVKFPTLPTAVTVNIQAAIKNLDSEYTTLGFVATVAGSAVTAGPYSTVTLQRGYLYRLQATGLSGTGTIIGKIGG